MGERQVSLEAIHAALWRELAQAAGDTAHGWRTPVLATVADGAEGPCADARTVVLREVHPVPRELWFYTDARSAKVRQLAAHPHATLVMWSAALGWQLRCSVTLTLIDSGPSRAERWERIRLSPAAQDYLSPLAPGSALDAPAVAVDRDHFCIVTAAVQAIDWLELHPQGHRRALFDGNDGRWVQP